MAGKPRSQRIAEKLVFPFQALVPIPPGKEVLLMTVARLVDISAEQARRFGIYLECPRGDEVFVAGATTVIPIDIESPSTAAIAEYTAYRAIVGPPPGVRDQPRFFRAWVSAFPVLEKEEALLLGRGQQFGEHESILRMNLGSSIPCSCLVAALAPPPWQRPER